MAGIPYDNEDHSAGAAVSTKPSFAPTIMKVTMIPMKSPKIDQKHRTDAIAHAATAMIQYFLR